MTAQVALAWVFLTGILVIVADYPASADLAAALAFLILAGVLVVYGPDAWANISKLVTVPGPRASRGTGPTLESGV